MKTMRSTLGRTAGTRRKFTKWHLPNRADRMLDDDGSQSASDTPAGERKGWIIAREDNLVFSVGIADHATAEVADQLPGIEKTTVVPGDASIQADPAQSKRAAS